MFVSMNKRRNILLALTWYHPKIHEGIAAFAREHNWHINSELTRNSAHIPCGWNGDGIICQEMFSSNEQAEFFNSLAQPRVVITHDYEKFQDYITVSDHHEAIADLAAAHFLERNFTNFACFCPSSQLVGVRVKRFISQIAKEGHSCKLLEPPASIKLWNKRRNWLIKALKKIPKPVAIFAQNDEFASEVIEACMDGGISIPEEIAVLGVRNDKLICETLNVPLSSVDNNLYGIGYKAAEELEKLLNGEKPEIRHYFIEPAGVQTRQSSDIIALPPGNERLQKALVFIRENFTDPELTSDMIAEAAAMSKRSLYSAFEEKVKLSPHKEIMRLRLEEAKQLLIATELLPEEIAERSGFRSMRNFYDAFKRELKTTPATFRTSKRSKKI